MHNYISFNFHDCDTLIFPNSAKENDKIFFLLGSLRRLIWLKLMKVILSRTEGSLDEMRCVQNDNLVKN